MYYVNNIYPIGGIKMAYFRSNNTLNEDEEIYTEDAEILDEATLGDVEAVYGDGIADKRSLMEALIIDCLTRMDDEQRANILNSTEFDQLAEAAGLNKMSDYERRVHLAALQKAKEVGDADWEALRKNRIKERQLQERIFKKYANRVARDVKVAQRNMEKINPQIFNTLRAVR